MEESYIGQLLCTVIQNMNIDETDDKTKCIAFINYINSNIYNNSKKISLEEIKNGFDLIKKICREEVELWNNLNNQEKQEANSLRDDVFDSVKDVIIKHLSEHKRLS
jgi:hypothetical protein